MESLAGIEADFACNFWHFSEGVGRALHSVKIRIRSGVALERRGEKNIFRIYRVLYLNLPPTPLGLTRIF